MLDGSFLGADSTNALKFAIVLIFRTGLIDLRLMTRASEVAGNVGIICWGGVTGTVAQGVTGLCDEQTPSSGEDCLTEFGVLGLSRSVDETLPNVCV